MTVEMFYAVALFEIPVIVLLGLLLAAYFFRERTRACDGCGAPIEIERESYWECSHGHVFHLACADFHSCAPCGGDPDGAAPGAESPGGVGE